MRIVQSGDDTDKIWEDAGRTPRNTVYDTIASQPDGTTIELVKGVDIPDMDDLNIYRQRLISGLRWRGVRVMTKIAGDIVYVKVLSREEVPQNGEEAEPVGRPDSGV